MTTIRIASRPSDLIHLDGVALGIVELLYRRSVRNLLRSHPRLSSKCFNLSQRCFGSVDQIGGNQRAPDGSEWWWPDASLIQAVAARASVALRAGA